MRKILITLQKISQKVMEKNSVSFYSKMSPMELNRIEILPFLKYVSKI